MKPRIYRRYGLWWVTGITRFPGCASTIQKAWEDYERRGNSQ